MHDAPLRIAAYSTART